MQTGCEAVAGAWEALSPSLLGRLTQGMQTASVLYGADVVSQWKRTFDYWENRTDKGSSGGAWEALFATRPSLRWGSVSACSQQM